ncbi:hypothetical protein [Streptomyces sp. NBC_01216]|uniref:hypothetical protein n=1 Tax=unclassified Streptomyces TaxID=2593676 RepID=UPI002E10FA0E|nr:hypothetical protein OG393_00875 [Streptomyces sp. NBC_01216]
MQHTGAESWVEVAVVARVFGADVLRCGRRVLTALVHRAVAEIGATAAPLRPGGPRDGRCGVRR